MVVTFQSPSLRSKKCTLRRSIFRAPPERAVTSAVASTIGARAWTGTASRTINLIQEGSFYGDDNLHQLDLRVGKRLDLGPYRVRFDFDIYNVFNSSWPYTVSATYSTAATGQWLRPTNVLQSRFFKLGGQISF